ncbi:MAG: multiheme c-type cytochrome, partial [Planctomycetaceae bacterium]
MITSRPKLRGIAGVTLLISVVVVVIVLLRRDSRVPEDKPLTELRDGVFLIPPDDYIETVKQLIKPNAVFLPAPQEQAEFTSHKSAAEMYLGPESCRECHASYVDSASQTAHYKTCRLADQLSTPDAFEAGHNVLLTSSPDMYFEMSKKKGRFFQSLFIRRPGERYVHTRPIDLVTGSAKYGQTFLYWENQCLYELPVSHFSDLGDWVNSPGYVNGVANFARPISSRCVECHTTWFEQSGTPFNRFTAERAVLGVTCEKCHGPGRQHAEYHRTNPAATNPEHIINPGSLSRDRSLDLCSLCHSGAGEPIGESFRFRPGDRLADFIHIPPDTESTPGGVHSANQQARMALSRCFQESSDMQCTTCHNPHQQERGKTKLFVARCLKCHDATDCGIVVKVGNAAEERCIDCHMPRRADSKMPMQKQHETFRPMLRDHLINKWEDVTAEILKEIS